MRFLLVDDDPWKISTVRDFLIGSGVSGSDVLDASHAAAARQMLSKFAIDVLLVDVLLPSRQGALPDGEVCVDLLRQIIEDGTTPAPSTILGMTASTEAREQFWGAFNSLVTHVLHVAPGVSEWQQTLSTLLTRLRHTEACKNVYDFDICVLNALRAPELEAVINSWPLDLEAEQTLKSNIVYREGTVLLTDSAPHRIVCAHLSQMGPVAAAHAATAVLEQFRPKLLVMTGICGGFADHVSVGDIVVAEKSWDWQAGKWSGDVVLETSLDQRDASPELVAVARQVDAKLDAIKAAYDGETPENIPRLHFGPMVTGSSVVASNAIQQVFRNQHRKMLAVDMECYGLYYAASNNGNLPVKVICIKSVSDLADRAKGDDAQLYCSFMSAQVALEVVRQYFRHLNRC